MGSVARRNRGSPLNFRANPQIRGAARWLWRRVTESSALTMAPPKPMAARRRRLRTERAAIAALLSVATLSTIGAAQDLSPLREPGTVSSALITTGPLGEITPDPPAIPAQTANPLAPPAAPPPPRAQRPLAPPPRQDEKPPPQQAGPSPGQQEPSPGQDGPPPEPPPPPPPPRGHVQLAP